MLRIKDTPPLEVEIPGEPGESATRYHVDVMIRKMVKSTFELTDKEARSYIVIVPESKKVLLNTEVHDAIKKSYVLLENIDLDETEVRIHIDTVMRELSVPVEI